MNIKKLSIFRFSFIELIVSLNLALIFAGYQFAASLLLPLGYTDAIDSQRITVPYRIFALIISFIALFCGILKSNNHPKFSLNIKLFSIAFVFFMMHVFFDIAADKTGYMQQEGIRCIGIIISSFLASLSIFYTYRLIRFDLALLMIFIMGIFVLSLRPLGIGITTADLFLDSSMQRIDGSVGLGSILYGHLGAYIAIISCYLIAKSKIFIKLISLPIILLGVYGMLNSGSRSPLLLFFVTISTFVSSIFGLQIIAIFILAFISIFCYIFRFELVEMMAPFFPVLSHRMELMIRQDNFSGRDILIKEGFNIFLQNPILGTSTVDTISGLTPLVGYHSSIIDAFARTGFIYGILYTWLTLYVIIKSFNMFVHWKEIPHFWIIMLIFGITFTEILTGGIIFKNPIFSACTLILLINIDDIKKYSISGLQYMTKS